MKNYISENISFLVKKGKHTQDDFGLLFDLKKGVINQYILGKSNPKIETVQRICDYFKITIDNFINTDLSKSNDLKTSGPGKTNLKEVNIDSISKEIEIRDELLTVYKEKIQNLSDANIKLETLINIENKIDQSTKMNQSFFKELEEQFEYLNLKENLEKAKNIKIQREQ